ncbi:MAG: efflux RND transporter permease subunit, partial [Polyangiales bacterium]
MSLTGAAIKRNRVTTVAVGVLLAAGIGVYGGMPRAMDPGFIIRAAQVTTSFPGASPERVEQLVTDPIEKAIQEIPELDYITSESRTGISIITVNIKNRYKVMRPIWDNLRRKVDRAARALPVGVGQPQVNDEFGDTFNLIFTIGSDGFSYAEIKDIADDVRDELLRIADVAKVDILGAQEERVFVEYNNAKLAQLGLSPTQLQNILEARNIILPGGDIDLGSERIVLEPSGNFLSVEELRQTVIQIPGSEELAQLSDIAEIERGYVDPAKARVRAGGLPALALAISMREGGNLIGLGEQVQALMQSLPAQYPHGVEFAVTFFEPETVDKKVQEFASNVLQSVLIVLLVMLLTLGLRTGAVVATLIPATMIISLLVISMLGLSLNQISLAALIIALGLLVDNAIVMSESIMVQAAAGKSLFQAAVDAAKELAVPLLTSSLTTGAAFLPIYLAESNAGEYTGVLFVVVTAALLISWGLSLTMIPLLSVTFFRVQKQEENFDTPIYRGYRGMLTWVLKHRWLTTLLTVASFAGALQLMRFVPKIFFPPDDRPFFIADFELPMGTPIERTEALVGKIESFVERELRPDKKRTEGVTDYTAWIGATPPRFVLSYTPNKAEPHRAVLMFDTSSYEAIDPAMQKLERWSKRSFPDVTTYIRKLQTGPPVDKPIQIRLSGRETNKLFAMVDAAKAKLKAMDGPRNIDDDWGARVKKFAVEVDEARARRAGVTNLDVALSLQTYLSGLEVTEYREDDKVIPVVMRSTADARRDLDRLQTLSVFSSASGRSVPLRQVADIELAFQPSVVYRRDRMRTVTVESELDLGVTATEAIAALTPWLEQQQAGWGLGYRYAFGGEIEKSSEAQTSIGDKLPLAGLAILMLLVWQFNSIRRPAIILF